MTTPSPNAWCNDRELNEIMWANEIHTLDKPLVKALYLLIAAREKAARIAGMEAAMAVAEGYAYQHTGMLPKEAYHEWCITHDIRALIAKERAP